MSPTPTYGDRSETNPSLPDENDAARRSKSRTTKDDPTTDVEVETASLKPDHAPDQ